MRATGRSSAVSFRTFLFHRAAPQRAQRPLDLHFVIPVEHAQLRTVHLVAEPLVGMHQLPKAHDEAVTVEEKTDAAAIAQPRKVAFEAGSGGFEHAPPASLERDAGLGRELA